MELGYLIYQVNKYKNKIVNIGIIVLALIIANNIYKAQATAVKSLRQSKDTEIQKNEILGDIGRSEKKISAYKRALEKKDVLVIDDLTDMAGGCGVKIISVKPAAEKAYPVYIKYFFDLVISTQNYHQVGKFISKIENSPNIYIIERLNIKPFSGTEGRGEGARISAVLTVSTVFFKG